MMNHEIEIISERSNHHFADRRAETFSVKMRARHRSFAHHNPLGINEVHQVRDPKAEILAHLLKDFAVPLIAILGSLNHFA